MILTSTLRVLLLALGFLIWSGTLTGCGTTGTVTLAPTAVPTLAAGAVPDFGMHVMPILQQHCIACHAGRFAQGGYNLISYDAVMTSGHNAPNVVGGDLSSNLIRMIQGETTAAGGPMPPVDRLSAEEVATIVRWVEAGAPPPSTAALTP